MNEYNDSNDHNGNTVKLQIEDPSFYQYKLS